LVRSFLTHHFLAHFLLLPLVAATMASLSSSPPTFITALIAGGMAGTSVDVTLFPIDTLKTRLQAPAGFWKAGGVTGIYNGIGAAAAGSAPGAALFFSTYECMKPVVLQWQEAAGFHDQPAVSHMVAASFGEAAACFVRVPTGVVTAKMQISSKPGTVMETFRMVLQERHGGSILSGFTGGLYRGFGITLFREIPFAAMQFPMYEKMKSVWADRQGVMQVNPLQAAMCGSLSGAIAGAATTPLDVLKTRLMLGVDKHGVHYQGVGDVFRRTLAEEGRSGFLKGLQPRVMWISIGGFVFFGAYEGSKKVVTPIFG
jgi:solute carrier family 25 S-adenosylmethionine transporter 26